MIRTLHHHNSILEKAPRVGSYLICPPEAVYRLALPEVGDVALRLQRVIRREGEPDWLIWLHGKQYWKTYVGMRQIPRRSITVAQMELRIEGKALHTAEVALAREIDAALPVMRDNSDLI